MAWNTTATMMTRALLLLGVCLTLSACGLMAPRSDPGYANLDSPGMMDTDREMVLSIGPTLLRFAANHMDDEPETQALLRSLNGVRLRIYEIDGDPTRVAARMDRMQGRLEDDGWTPLMLVRTEDERTQLLLKSTGELVHGLTLLTSDGDSEAVVINLIGDIQPQFFSDVMVALEIDEGGAQEVQVAMMAPCASASSDTLSSEQYSPSAARPASPRAHPCGSKERPSALKSRIPATSRNLD